MNDLISSTNVNPFSLKISDEMFEANQKEQIQKLRSSVNDKALCQLVAGLSGGKKCTVDYGAARFGGANYHPRIVFDDGSPSWLVRIPRGGWPLVLEERLVRSEFATLKFLESTRIPSPRAFGCDIRGEQGNGVGVSYLLMEEVAGTVWHPGRVSRISAAQELEKVFSGLADIMIELSRYPLDSIGSFHHRPFALDISTLASDQTLVLSPTGPFKSSHAYYTAYTEQYLALIADEQTYTKFPVEAYLIYAYLKDNVGQLCETESHEPERFFLKHVDDKGDHLMVDQDLNIVGVIDWQMARVAPAREAFGPSLVTADMDSLCNGKNGLTSKDRLLASILHTKGAVELAEIMSANEKVRRFMWGLGAETDWKYAEPLAMALLRAFGQGADVEWEHWKEQQLQSRHSDVRLKDLLDRIRHRT